MKRYISSLTIALLIGLVIGLLLGIGRGSVVAQQGGNGGGNLGAHHQELSFTLAPDQTQTIPFPKLDSAISVDVSASTVSVDCGNGIIESLGPFSLGGVTSFDSVTGRVSRRIDNDEEVISSLECASNNAGRVVIFLTTDQTTGNILIGSRSESAHQIVSAVTYSVNLWY